MRLNINQQQQPFSGLSALSDADLLALEEGRMQDISDAGLDVIEKTETPQQESIPDALRRVGRGVVGGGAQAATAGYAPEITGAIASGVGKLQDYFSPIIDPASGNKIPRVGSYLESRDATARELNKRAEEAPIAYYGTNLAGNIGSVGLLAKLFGGSRGVVRGAKAGAAVAGLQNPGSVEGVIDPLQPAERLVQAGVGGIVGGAAGGVGSLASRAKAKMDLYDKLGSGGVAKEASEKIKEATKMAVKNVIQPASKQLDDLLADKQFQVNADLVKKVMPRYGESLSRRATAEGVLPAVETRTFPAAAEAVEEIDNLSALLRNKPPQPVQYTPYPPQVDVSYAPPKALGPLRAEISGTRLRDLKQAADSIAEYGKPESAAFAAGKPKRVAAAPEAVRLGNIARRMINEDPQRAALNKTIEEASSGISKIRRAAQTSPIETLTKPTGSTTRDLLVTLDKQAGTNLAEYGDLIKDAAALHKGGLSDLAMPLQQRPELLRLLELGASKTGRAINDASSRLPSSQVPLNVILEAVRRNK